jgi:hypothetical protein
LPDHEPDAWDQPSLASYVRQVYEKNPQTVSDERRKLLTVNISALSNSRWTAWIRLRTSLIRMLRLL